MLLKNATSPTATTYHKTLTLYLRLRVCTLHIISYSMVPVRKLIEATRARFFSKTSFFYDVASIFRSSPKLFVPESAPQNKEHHENGGKFRLYVHAY